MQVTERDVVFEAGDMALELRFKDKALAAQAAELAEYRARVEDLEQQIANLAPQVLTCGQVHPQQDIHCSGGHPVTPPLVPHPSV